MKFLFACAHSSVVTHSFSRTSTSYQDKMALTSGDLERGWCFQTQESSFCLSISWSFQHMADVTLGTVTQKIKYRPRNFRLFLIFLSRTMGNKTVHAYMCRPLELLKRSPLWMHFSKQLSPNCICTPCSRAISLPPRNALAPVVAFGLPATVPVSALLTQLAVSEQISLFHQVPGDPR